jgi:hypothetical protein
MIRLKIYFANGCALWTLGFMTIIVCATICFPTPADGNQYTESCDKNTDCSDTNYCDLVTRTCNCITNHAKIHQVFDTTRKICVSTVGSACTIPQESTVFVYKFLCGSNAECSHYRGMPTTMGKCKCKLGYFETKENACGTAAEVNPLREQKTGAVVQSKSPLDSDGPPANSVPQWIRSSSAKSSPTISTSFLCALWVLMILMTNFS